ncbi:MAG: recombinase XerC [Alphaproteobacteria bacterium]|nr:MAG: recombinase XerC [Alphaproteobacteria bacterium]
MTSSKEGVLTPGLQQDWAAWQGWLKYEKRYSAHTQLAYVTDTDHFFLFYRSHLGLDGALDLEALKALDTTTIRSWLSQRRLREKKAPATLARALSSLRSFFGFVTQKYGIKNSVFDHIQAPKLAKLMPKGISFDDFLHLIEPLQDQASWQGMRDLALITLLYGTGLRISEALGLKQGDITDQTMEIVIKGKGNKSRMVPILPEIVVLIDRYRKACLYEGETTSPLFLGNRGGALSPSASQKMLLKMRRELSLPETLTPHALRHSYATHLLQGGADLRVIQELLGHASLSTTQRYAHADMKHIQSVYHSKHPRR